MVPGGGGDGCVVLVVTAACWETAVQRQRRAMLTLLLALSRLNGRDRFDSLSIYKDAERHIRIRNTEYIRTKDKTDKHSHDALPWHLRLGILS